MSARPLLPSPPPPRHRSADEDADVTSVKSPFSEVARSGSRM